MKYEPLIATFFPSNLTVVVPSFRWSPEVPRFGSGVGTKGAGGPGILHTFGVVASALPPLPSVTGVLGGLTAMVLICCFPGLGVVRRSPLQPGHPFLNWPRSWSSGPWRTHAAQP